MTARRPIGIGLAAMGLALSACSSDNNEPSAEATATVTTTVIAEPGGTGSPTSSDNEAEVGAQEYFESLANLRPADAADAADLAAPGSDAAAYATFRSAYHQAELDAGFDSAGHAIPLETSDGGFRLCPAIPETAGEACDEGITEITGRDGRIATFKVGSNDLNDVITVSNGKPRPLGDGDVKMIAAYQTMAGDVVVVFEVTSGPTPLDLSYVSDYRSRRGRQMEDTDLSLRPSSLPPESIANVSLTFRGAEFGGKVTYRAYPDNDSSRELTATFGLQ